jgi:nicotinate phosphoribosyltransferase
MKNLSLLTDYYELSMMQGYYYKNPEEEAVFDMFFRRQPFGSGFTLFVGLDPLIDAITDLHFGAEEIEYLRSLGAFRQEFLEYLERFRFTGDVYAQEEARVVFPNEPLIRVQGKLIHAQLLESLILNHINFQSLIATKAARVVIAAQDRAVLEFGLRRAHGVDGALSAARAAFIGGVAATSNVLAGKEFKIPVSGTMAHSWVMSFDSELEAFRQYAKTYPDNCILLVDTFDTMKSGIPNAIKVFKELRSEGKENMGVRLDSGDLEYLSKAARKMFDEAGLYEVKIYASNELDEYVINQIMKNGARIDAWGVGTKLITADGDPALSGVYKIAAKGTGRDLRPTIKVSNNPEKITNPGVKNVYRFYDHAGMMLADLIYLQTEQEMLDSMVERREGIRFNHPNIDYAHFSTSDYARTESMLQPVIMGGKRVYGSRALIDLQSFAQSQIAALHPTYKRLLNPHVYKVSISDGLKALKNELIHECCQ